MRLFRYLQHWLAGHGTRLQVADFVPPTLPPPAMGRYVSLDYAGGSDQEKLCPAFPQRRHPWPSTRLASGVTGIGVAQTRSGCFRRRHLSPLAHRLCRHVRLWYRGRPAGLLAGALCVARNPGPISQPH